MVIETGEADPDDSAAVAQAISQYRGSGNLIARTDLIRRYFERLLGGHTAPSYLATDPPLLAYGEEQLLRGSRLNPSRDASLPPIEGEFEPNRRVEFFFMETATALRSEYLRWTTPCTSAEVTPTVTVAITSVAIIGKNHATDIGVTLNPSPLPAGISVTLALSTISGTGEARFTSTNSITMTVIQSGPVIVSGITESSVVDNIRLTARITGQTQDLAQEEFTVLFVEVTEINFQSGIDIYDAASDTIIPATGPEWQLAPLTNHPAAYVRNGGGSDLARVLRISATTVSGFSGTLSLKAVGPSGSNVEIGQVDIAFSGGTASNIAMQFTTLPNTVKRLNNINLQWQYQHSSWSSFADANTSTHTFYILDAPPLSDVVPYIDLLDFSCNWADAQSGAANVFNRIWAEIRSQNTHPDPAQRWTYYGPGDEDELARSTRDLIVTHNGDCTAWAHFMADCCRIHGIDAEFIAIAPGIIELPETRYSGILVNNVTYGDVYNDGPPRISWGYPPPRSEEDERSPLGVPRLRPPEPSLPIGVSSLNTDPPGIPGQGMDTPHMKSFGFHAVVRYVGTYYDPSYMVTWGSKTAFRNALAGQLWIMFVVGLGLYPFEYVMVHHPPYPYPDERDL